MALMDQLYWHIAISSISLFITNKTLYRKKFQHATMNNLSVSLFNYYFLTAVLKKYISIF